MKPINWNSSDVPSLYILDISKDNPIGSDWIQVAEDIVDVTVSSYDPCVWVVKKDGEVYKLEQSISSSHF